MTRSLKNIILNAVLAPKESAHQFDTTQRIRAFLAAAGAGNAKQVTKILAEGIDTTNYEDRKVGKYSTKNWLMSGLMEAMGKGRPATVPLIADRLFGEWQERVKASDNASYQTQCELLQMSVTSLADAAGAMALQASTAMTSEMIHRATNMSGAEKTPLNSWREDLGTSRKVSRLVDDFNEVSKVMKVTRTECLRFIRTETTFRNQALDARAKAEAERLRQAAEAEKAALEAIPANATELKRNIRPVRTVKFKAVA